MENRINQLFKKKQRNVLSVFFTAGFPRLTDTGTIIELLEKNGTDMVEIGIPFSDPTADGPVIQNSSEVALHNGMKLGLLFEQLSHIREKVKIPLILMGYFNPVLQFGVERFCRKCRETGIDGVILPDLPLWEYNNRYRSFFEKNGLHNILMITPQTSDKRIRETDAASKGFIYMVSSSSTTGSWKKASDFYSAYFERVKDLSLKNPCMIGFGISDKTSFDNACQYAAGAIIGSAFIMALQEPQPLTVVIEKFIKSIMNSIGNDMDINLRR